MNLSDKVHKVIALHHDDKLLQAARLLAEIDAEIDSSANPRSLIDVLEENADTLATIRRETQDITTLFGEMNSNAGWDVAYQGPVTSVRYKRYEEDGGLLTFRIESTLVARVVNLACVVYEVDLYDRLFWFVKNMKALESKGRMQMVTYLRVKLFWPMLDREFYSYGYGVDALDEDDCILIYTRDLAERPDKIGEHKKTMDAKSQDTVRGSIKAAFRFTAVTASTTKMMLIAKVDPAISFAPLPLVNWFGKTIGRAVPKMFESMANRLTEEHKNRLENGSFYRWYRDRMEDFWTRKGDQQALEDMRKGKVDTVDESRRSKEFDIAAVKKGPGARALMKR